MSEQQQQPHTIEIFVKPDGEVEATVKGIKGPACGDASKFLDELGVVVEDQHTAEYFEQPVDQDHHNITGTGGREW